MKRFLFYLIWFFSYSLQAAVPAWVTHLRDRGFRAVIFDMDDTIINTQEVLKDAVVRAIEALRGVPLLERDKLFAQRNVLFAAERIGLFLKVSYRLEKDIEEINEQMSLALNASVVEKLQYLDGFELFIQQLKDHGFYVALGTNAGMGFVDMVNRKLGLNSYFQNHLYSCNELGFLQKPDPLVFLHSAKQLGVSPFECLVIGDSEADARAAQYASMPSICIEHNCNAGSRLEFAATASSYAVIESALLQIQPRAAVFGTYVAGMGIAEILQ